MTMDGAAKISDNKAWRYWLTRRWGPGPSTVNFVMLNPSTADATHNDSTVRRCIGYAQEWLFHRLVVTNLFAFRSKRPEDLWEDTEEPVGPDNDKYLLEEAQKAGLVVVAWGTHGSFRDRGQQVLKMFALDGIQVHHLGLTKEGHPKHPLYLRKNIQPIEYDLGDFKHGKGVSDASG